MVIRMVVLISGNGTNLQSLIDNCGTAKLPDTEITHVISDRKNAKGLERAKTANIPTTYLGIMQFRAKPRDQQTADDQEQERTAYDGALAGQILSHKPDIVVCAGFMRVLTEVFLSLLAAASIPIINLHPSLPAPNLIAGAGAIERAFNMYQSKEIGKTGIMIHYVTKDVDQGTPITWREVEIKDSDTLDDLEQRVHETEWALIVEGTRMAIEDLQGTGP